jgi:hypothetical protein
VAVTLPDEAGVRVSDQERDSVSREPGGERVRGERVAEVVEAGKRLGHASLATGAAERVVGLGLPDDVVRSLGEDASAEARPLEAAERRDGGEGLAAATAEDERSVGRSPRREEMSPKPRDVLLGDRDVPPTRVRLRRNVGVPTVISADAVE